MTSSAIAMMAALAAPSTAALEIGQPAPSVRAKNQDGQIVDLGALYGRQPVVVFFYPKSFTGG